MPRFFNLWELDTSKMPGDPNERMAVLKKLLEVTKQFLKDNPGSDWGVFVGESQGYALGAKNWQELEKIHYMLSPYVRFKVYQATSMAENEELNNAMISMMQKK